MVKRFIFISLVLVLFTVFKPQISHAEVVHNFDSVVVAHKNGVIDVAETIDYDFQALDKHGIYRYIPLFSRVGNLYRIISIKNVKVLRDGAGEYFTLNQNTGQIYLKIGKADKLITGEHVYKINYSVENAIGSNFSDHDEIYWNVTGNDWQVNIEKASAKISTDFGVKQKQIICFEGASGSKDKN